MAASDSHQQPDSELRVPQEVLDMLTSSGVLETLGKLAKDEAIRNTLSELFKSASDHDRAIAMINMQVATTGRLSTLDLPKGALVDLHLADWDRIVDCDAGSSLSLRMLSARAMGGGVLKLLGNRYESGYKAAREPFDVDDLIEVGTIAREPRGAINFDRDLREEESVAVKRGKGVHVIGAKRSSGARVKLALVSVSIDDIQVLPRVDTEREGED